MAYVKGVWVDDDGSGTTGTPVSKAIMDNIEQGVANAHPGPWHNIGDAGEPAFANGWVNFDAIRIARYYKAGGRVYLEGIVKNGAIGSVMFTLPVGARPTIGGSALIYPVVGNNAFGVVFVDQNGNVTAVNPTSNVFVDLSSISFRCE